MAVRRIINFATFLRSHCEPAKQSKFPPLRLRGGLGELKMSFPRKRESIIFLCHLLDKNSFVPFFKKRDVKNAGR